MTLCSSSFVLSFNHATNLYGGCCDCSLYAMILLFCSQYYKVLWCNFCGEEDASSTMRNFSRSTRLINILTIFAQRFVCDHLHNLHYIQKNHVRGPKFTSFFNFIKSKTKFRSLASRIGELLYANEIQFEWNKERLRTVTTTTKHLVGDDDFVTRGRHLDFCTTTTQLSWSMGE